VTFLGAVINKKLDWTYHMDQLEKDLYKQNGVIHRLTSYLPQHAQLSLAKGFFSPKISYLIDVYSDPTGEGRRSGRKTVGIIHRLQMHQNDAIRSALRIKKKDHIGTESLLMWSGVIGVKEMSIRANCMMALRLFAQYRDLQDLAGPQLWLREYKYPTREATAGVLPQETEFANFVKKGAAIYNLMGKEITSSKSKEQDKSRMNK
jgi:hypothetical protein